MNPRDEIAHLTPDLRRFARALALPDSEDRSEVADHLVQEAIVRALRTEWNARQSNLRLWLYATIIGLNRARLRSWATHSQGADDVEAVSRPAIALFGGRTLSVLQALDQLGCEEREALILIVLEGLNYAEACEAIKIARPTLIARLARARRALAESFDSAQVRDQRGRRARPHLRVVK